MEKKHLAHIVSAIVISHNFGIITSICDRVVVIDREGRMVEEGDTARLLENPKHVETKSLVNASVKLGQMEI